MAMCSRALLPVGWEITRWTICVKKFSHASQFSMRPMKKMRLQPASPRLKIPLLTPGAGVTFPRRGQRRWFFGLRSANGPSERCNKGGIQESFSVRSRSLDPKFSRGWAARLCHIARIHCALTKCRSHCGSNSFSGGIRNPGIAWAGTGYGEFCATTHGMGGRRSFLPQNAPESGLGVSGELCGKFVLRLAVLPGGDELRHGWRWGSRRIDEIGGAEKDHRVYGSRATRLGNRLHQRSLMQLDGDAGSGAGHGFAFDDRQSCSDVAADHDVFCARLRAFDREHVFDPHGYVVRRRCLAEPVVDLEPDSSHIGQLGLRRLAHRTRAVCHKHAEESRVHGNSLAH